MIQFDDYLINDIKLKIGIINRLALPVGLEYHPLVHDNVQTKLVGVAIIAHLENG